MAEHFVTGVTGVLDRLGVASGKIRRLVLYNWSRWATARTSQVARAAAAPLGGGGRGLTLPKRHQADRPARALSEPLPIPGGAGRIGS